MENKKILKNFHNTKVENISENSQDLLIKREIEKWIKNNAEKLAKEIINEQAKKFLNNLNFIESPFKMKNYICPHQLWQS